MLEPGSAESESHGRWRSQNSRLPSKFLKVGLSFVKIRSGVRLWVLRCRERMIVEMMED